MQGFRIGISFVASGLILFLFACKKDDGASPRRPVNNAQTDNSVSDKKANEDRDRLIQKIRNSGHKSDQLLGVEPRFSNRASSVGLDFTQFRDAKPNRFFFPEIMGSGMAWIDFDLDGYWDLYVGNGDALQGPSTHLNQLFRNHAGENFISVTDSASPDGSGFAQGMATGDFNRDGFEDLFVSNFGQSFLLVNLGDGSFEKRLVPAPEGNSNWGSSCVLVDLDSDGDLDIFLARYIEWNVELHRECRYSNTVGYCGPGQFQGTSDLLYENQGDGTFVEVHESAGIDFKSKGLAVCAADFDGDRIPEIYVGSDLTPNAYYRRTQTGGSKQLSYANGSDDAGIASSKNGIDQATMGLAVCDFDQNGLPDLFLTHYYQDQNTLYLNQGKHLFKDASYESRIRATSLQTIGFGTVPIDYDNDGDFDLFVTNGHVLGKHIPPFRFSPQLLSNQDLKFQDVGQSAGEYFQQKYAGRSVAKCDFDNDGDVDITIGHVDDPLALLVDETKSSNKAIQIQLLDVERKDTVGSSVQVVTASRTITLPVVKGESYLVASDPRLCVGTGADEKVTVRVRWASGTDSEFKELATGSTWLLRSDNSSYRMK